MVCFTVCGLRLAVDFTAPALLALLSLMLPPDAFFRTLAACLLHECAHLLTIALTGQKPKLLRFSAIGMQLEMQAPALCPTGRLVLILCAGPAANLLAAAIFSICGFPESAAANLSPALFNLLPVCGTDGGSLLYTLAEHRYIRSRPELPARILRAASLLTAAALAVLLLSARNRNPLLWGMLGYLTIAAAAGGTLQDKKRSLSKPERLLTCRSSSISDELRMGLRPKTC